MMNLNKEQHVPPQIYIRLHIMNSRIREAWDFSRRNMLLTIQSLKCNNSRSEVVFIWIGI